MSKWLILVVFTFLSTTILRAQQNNLEIKGTGSSIYLDHVVAPKENFYSVGRMFNINPKDLAAFNHLHFASGLNIGQELKIPLSKNNFTQVKSSLPGEALIPVYHTVVAGETLYRLGVNYNKVPLSSLKKWNNLSSDAVTVGAPMVVGFLKVDKNQSSLANEQPAANVASAKDSQPTIPTVATPEKKEEPVAPAPTEVQPSQPKPEPAPAEKAAVTITPTNNAPGTNSISTGYFKSLFEQQTADNLSINKNGSAGVFKSTSGWQDGKYYCFSNDADAGTILKITNAATGKSVYAKVLDVIPDISQNDGLITVISNSAADKLGAGNDNFECNVAYAKK
ncbi:MAG: LysM peptidoglycan-binding domain-containing protein [Ginsengibacter sp.]